VPLSALAANGTPVTEATAAAAPKPRPHSTAPTFTRLLKHNGEEIFLTGVNLGNVQFLPF
jgi:hypothetical protein